MKQKHRVKTKRSSRPSFISSFFNSVFRAVKIGLPLAAFAVLFFLMFQGVRHYLFADDFFRLVAVNAHTNGILSPDEITRIAGVTLGKNVLSLDIQKVTERLESDPRIREAVVTRVLPNQISVEIKERRQFLRVKSSGSDQVSVMDEDGFLLGPAAADSALPVFEDLRPEAKDAFKGGRYQDKGMLRMMFEIKNVISREPLLEGKNILSIKVDSPERICIGFEGGFEVLVSKNFADEIAKLEPLRQALEKDLEAFEYLDLRFKDVVARKKQERKNNGRLKR